MKEAAGEANMTVITIVLIAIVLAVGTLVVNRLMTTTENKSCCASLGGEVNGGQCVSNQGTETMDAAWRNLNCPDNN